MEIPHLPKIIEEQQSDSGSPSFPGLKTVMAEQSVHDVVKQSQSVGDASPSDVPATNFTDKNAAGDAGRTNEQSTNDPVTSEYYANAAQGSQKEARDANSGAVSTNGIQSEGRSVRFALSHGSTGSLTGDRIVNSKTPRNIQRKLLLQKRSLMARYLPL